MDADTKTLSAKPLGPLGRGEMNVTVFPITLLADRVPRDQTKAGVLNDDEAALQDTPSSPD